MSQLDELIKEALLKSNPALDQPIKRTTKQALMAELVIAQRALLEVGDILLSESGEELTQSFTDADLAYACGYLGAAAATVGSLSNFIRTYPTE